MSRRQIDRLIADDLQVLWHPCSQMRDYRDFPPLPIVSAKGCRLHLADGRTLLDPISSWWCKSLGHGHPKLRRAMIEQAKRFEHVILANTTNEPIVRLCRRLLEMARPPLKTSRRTAPFHKVFLADNGSTGVEIAIKMALQAQQQRGQARRVHFAALENGYHGETVATLSVGDCGLYGRPYRPMMFPVMKLKNLPYRCGDSDPDWMDASAQWPPIEAQLNRKADTLAAIVYEPVLQGAAGMRFYSPDLLVRLRRWADEHEVYLIADEIAAGFGRLGTMLASHLTLTSAMPDLLVLSKGLTGGFMPLSAVLIPNSIYDLFDADYLDGKAFLHSNTYTGHALAVAVANAVLDVFDQETILQQVARRGPLLTQGLQALAAERSDLKNVRGLGMVAAVDLRHPDGSPLPKQARTGYQVYRRAIELGALFRPMGDTLYLFPPLNTSARDIATMLDILGRSLPKDGNRQAQRARRHRGSGRWSVSSSMASEV